jgi:hypothetical protein
VDIPESSLRRSARVRNPPRRYDDFVSLVINNEEPTCYQEAMEVSDREKWKEAMKEEMDALERNETWDLVELPKDRKIVGRKWVSKLKLGVYDKVERYKTRLVEKCYSHKEGIDFHEIFSPVVKLISIRFVLALVALFNMKLEQLDAKTTFLHGDLDEEIYIEQLEGFVQDCRKIFVCKLKKLV